MTTPAPTPDKKPGGIKGWLLDLIGNLLADPRMQQAVKNILGSLITERILPLVPVAAAAAGKAAADQIIAKVPQLAEVAHDVVSVAHVAEQVRTDLNNLIPDFDLGIPPLDNLMDFWRPKS